MTNNETPNILTPSSAASALALKTHLHTLHQNLAAAGGDVDDETQDLLRQLDSDIKQVLERRAADAADADAYGLSTRAQELSASFAVKHPRLEPALRELGNMLASMGI
ncbi:DUF4404 family protein [Massilia sp. S19_KUP03_FR1]|uniref:DUF4404 family protein n=1 Tax=Massilia sp. S19_KUP03_FR1 TaxID=3025503 RepID=UPI002FCD963B